MDRRTRWFAWLTVTALTIALGATVLLARRSQTERGARAADSVALAATSSVERLLSGTGPYRIERGPDGRWVATDGTDEVELEAIRTRLSDFTEQERWELLVVELATGLVEARADVPVAVGADVPDERIAGRVPGGATGIGRLEGAKGAYGVPPSATGWAIVVLPGEGRGPVLPDLLAVLPLLAVVLVAIPGWLLVRSGERERRAEATRDELTGLPNLAGFQALLERGGETPFAVVRIDLDGFAVVNRARGRAVGDAVLRRCAERLAGSVRHQDGAARLGDDEFAVIMWDVEDEQAARYLARRLARVLSEPIHLDGYDLALTVSLGVVVSSDTADRAHLLDRADVALQAAKRAPTSIVVWEPALVEQTELTAELVGDLRNALERDDLGIVFQPIFDLRTNRIVTFEALARWPDADRGLIPPGVFVPAAETAGLITSLTRYVLDHAILQVVAWRELGYPVRVSVNLSARDLAWQHLPEEVSRLLERHGCSPGWLQLEVTETAVITDIQGASEVLHRLRDRGVALAIDDFGTGYASLAYLRSFPATDIKIDRSFLAGALGHHSDELIVRATIELAHVLGLTVTAEGLEHEEARERLIAWGCDHAQGYLLGRPLPANEATSLLASRGATTTTTTTAAGPPPRPGGQGT